jgi:hypothetical protein
MTSNRKFVQFIDAAKSDPRSLGFGIESLLIEPVQRIPRYRMLLEQLLKYTPPSHEEYDSITKALTKISELALENNEAIRSRENKEKMMEIMLQMDSRTRINLLDTPNRLLLRSGVLGRQCRLVDI